MALSMKGPVRLKLPRDPLFRLLAVNGLAGTAIAGLVLGGIFLGNIGNLRGFGPLPALGTNFFILRCSIQVIAFIKQHR